MNESFLLELLFIRASWGLPGGVGIPQLDPAPPLTWTTATTEAAATLGDEWDRQWELALTWLLGAEGRQSKLHALVEKPDPVAMSKLLPPRWLDAIVDDKFDVTVFYEWQQELEPFVPAELASTPERLSRVQLDAARVRGLRIIAIVPVEGVFDRQIDTSGLLLSWTTYNTASAFGDALDRFAAE